MTPLAQDICNRLLSRSGGAEFSGLTVHDLFDDVHCFDVTDVLDLIEDVANHIKSSGNLARYAFLPAPRTWIEMRLTIGPADGEPGEPGEPVPSREAVLLEADAGGCWVTAFGRMGVASEAGYNLKTPDGRARRYWIPLRQVCATEVRGLTLRGIEAFGGIIDPDEIYAALAIINTPRLIGRKQHMPHRGLERKLANAKGLVGKLPLHAWTELKLSVSAMMKQADGTVHEAHYTGEKCLHFCRAHLRVRNGRLEQVRAHWRGNPALGIKRTRYRLAA